VAFQASPRLSLRTGGGLYSGGTPNVWISNSYTNDGISIDSAFSSDTNVIGGFDGRTIPQDLRDSLQAGNGNVDAMDPDFKIPSTWKASAGAEYQFDAPFFGEQGRDFVVDLNYVFSKVNQGVQWRDLRRDLDSLPNNTPVGTLPDGRPYYDYEDTGDGEVFDERRGYDMLLTNTTKGYGHTASVSLKKKFPFGLSLTTSYGWQHIREVSPANSSRAVSNYGYAAVSDPDNPDVSRSNYERTHRIVAAARFARPLIADISGASGVWERMMTTLSVFVEGRSGQPFSYTFGDSAGGTDLARFFGEEREFARRNRQLFYVPKGDGSDVILNGIDEDEFNAFLKDTGLDEYRGQIAPRNAFTSKWLNRVDLRFAQELPSPARDHKLRVLLDIENVGNLLNPKWGRYEQVGFPFTVPVVDVAYDAVEQKYVYSNLRTGDPERVNVLASVWKIQVGAVYEF
jgi:hypothetical protein